MNIGEALAGFYECSENVDIAALPNSAILSGITHLLNSVILSGIAHLLNSVILSRRVTHLPNSVILSGVSGRACASTHGVERPAVGMGLFVSPRGILSTDFFASDSCRKFLFALMLGVCRKQVPRLRRAIRERIILLRSG